MAVAAFANPDRYQDLWQEEDESLTASEAAFRNGAASIAEVPDIDLAVVTVAESASRTGRHRLAGKWALGLHPMAINNATGRFVLLVVRGRSYELVRRYETWV